jgi:hypothetical protein
MILKLLKATAVLAIATVPVIAAAEPVYTDTQVYQVNPKYPYVVYPASYELNNHYSWDTTSYYFDPNLYYFQYEQQQIIANEAQVTGGTLSTDTDGSSLITVNQGSIPEATQQNVPATVESLPGGSGMQTQGTNYIKSYYRSQSFGNSLFGAGYVIDANITSTEATATAKKRVDAYAEGKVVATAFNNQQEIVRGRAEVHGQEGGANSGTAALYAMGQQIWSANLYYTFNATPINWSRTFFSVNKTFMVGPVPINVKASLSGGVKMTVSGEVGPTVAKLSATAGGWSNVTASASVSIIIASFGVEGNLTLINVSMPAYGELFWPYCTINWTLKSTLSLNTLAGNLSLFAKIKFLFFSKTWRVTIATWSGLTYNWTLVDLNGTKDLGICMFEMAPPPPTAEEQLLTADAH